MVDEIRVLIADDHELMREGLGTLLQRDRCIEIVDEVGDGQDAINVARRAQLDIILMDVNMPGIDGIGATRVIKKEQPSAKIIALTAYGDGKVLEMVKAGVSGYVLKDITGEELIDTIHKVMDGENVIHPRVFKRLIKELSNQEYQSQKLKLTKRERDVLAHLVTGSSNRDMAESMFISEKTVKNHLTSIFRKLGVKDRTQAAVYAIKSHMFNEAAE